MMPAQEHLLQSKAEEQEACVIQKKKTHQASERRKNIRTWFKEEQIVESFMKIKHKSSRLS